MKRDPSSLAAKPYAYGLCMLIAVTCLPAVEASSYGEGSESLAVTRHLNALSAGDDTERFRLEFCRQYAKHSDGYDEECDSWIWRLDTQPDLRTQATGDIASAPFSLVVIPGIFGECVSDWVSPFSEGHETLRARGIEVQVVPTLGRASTQQNARIITDFFNEKADDLGNVLVIAYSKGLSDFLVAASGRNFTWRSRVVALVSVAGTASGSPIAEDARVLYKNLLKRIPLKGCGPADGGGVASLTPDQAKLAREAFLSLAESERFPTYSIVAVAGEEKVNPVLRPFHTWLSRLDPHNDGQLLLKDAILPGSRLLGVYRADHWSIALPFESSSAWQTRFLSVNNRFPRRALLEAIVKFTSERRE